MNITAATTATKSEREGGGKRLQKLRSHEQRTTTRNVFDSATVNIIKRHKLFIKLAIIQRKLGSGAAGSQGELLPNGDG